MRYLVAFLMAVSLCMFSFGCKDDKKTKDDKKPAAGAKENEKEKAKAKENENEKKKGNGGT